MSKIGVSFIFLLVVSITYASIVNGLDYEVSRQFQKSSVETDDELDVKIIVDVGPNTDAYVIDEIIPQGWTIISSGGGSTNHTGHIKWVVCGETSGHSYDCTGLTCCINQIQDTEYIYTLKAPTSEGMGVFTGNYMFDTDLSEHTILGDTTIQVVNTASDCRGYSSEQQCSANTNCSWCPIGT
ncbi:MAG: hypothetical protein QXK37_06290, partial [Candidatus Woesearchaeota archaeon]